jgi:hypothetical protein
MGYSGSEMGHQGFLGRNIYYHASSGSVDFHPKAEPREQRGFALFIFVSRLWKQEAEFNTYMVVCISFGYFTLSAL